MQVRVSGSKDYSDKENAAVKTRRSKRALQWFANLNTLEFILLSCGIFVCLAGIMFESSKNDRRTLVRNETEFHHLVAFLLRRRLLLVLCTLLYGRDCPKRGGILLPALDALVKRGDDKAVADEYVEDNVELEENPLFTIKRVEIANNAELEGHVERSHRSLKEEHLKNKLLRDELYRIKMQEQVLEQHRKSNGAVPLANPNRQKKEFSREKAAETILARGRRSIRKKGAYNEVEDEVQQQE